MITSSEFFKKTFFDLEFENPSENPSKIKKNQNFNLINKTQLQRYSQLSNFTHNKNVQNFTTTKRIPTKDLQTFSSTKNRFNENYNQIQPYNGSSVKKNLRPQKQLDQFTIDVTPWNQHSNSMTSRQLYQSKHHLNKQRQKIKSTIQKYKFTRTIQQSQKKQHANFIKSPKKNKKVNYILYQYGNGKSKQSTRKKINLIKNVDLNKSYEQYLNHEIEFDKDFLFKSHIKVKTHNRHDGVLGHSHNKGLSRQGRNKSVMEKSQQKEFIDDAIKKDLVCSRYQDQINRQKLLDSASKEKQKQQQVEKNNVGKLSQRAKLLDKGKILKFQMNRRIFKGTKISLNGIAPTMDNNSMTERQKFFFEISGNKTRKLEYSHLTD